jgi:hypothetical protein
MATTRKRCPKGKILRKGYTTKKGVKVKPTCVKDMGKPGKGKKLFTLKKGELGKFGYAIKNNQDTRRKKFTYASLVHKLNALSILFKNTAPQYYKKLRSDMKWVQNNYKK